MSSASSTSGPTALTAESLSRLQISEPWLSSSTSSPRFGAGAGAGDADVRHVHAERFERERERERSMQPCIDRTRAKQWPCTSPHAHAHATHTHTHIPRMPSATPSVTSISDGEEEGDLSVHIDKEDVRTWLNKGKGKGKEKERDSGALSVSGSDGSSGGSGSSSGSSFGSAGMMSRSGSGIAERLPPEILIQIFRLLPDTRNLISALLVSRTWCLCAFSLIWHKPHLPAARHLASLVRVISSSSPSLPYSQAIRRVYLTQLAPTLSDELLCGFSACSKVERLTLTGASHISPEALITVFAGMPELSSVDLSNVMAVDDVVVTALAGNCPKLQALNLTKCKLVGDEGVRAVARYSKMLRRIKLVDCHRVTDASLIPLVQSCPLLLEIDVTDVLALSNASTYSTFLHSSSLRELRLNNCALLTEDCFPNLLELTEMPKDEVVRSAQSVGLSPNTHPTIPPIAGDEEEVDGLRYLRPITDMFDCLREVDMTGCESLGDKAIENLISNAPKIRTLTLAKCGNLTNAALDSICSLGKHLHYLHLGHLRNLTDEGVIRLAKTCTRLRYIDLACCELLTDASVIEIGANMPKLRRIGLVTNITDEAIYALVERYGSLERIHLSYCDKLSVKAITFLLNRLLHLKHLSLTGVSAFRNTELQRFCRAPPSNFNSHQRAAFCVYSGDRVNHLRHHLNLLSTTFESDGTSTRRGSGSSTSSITLPGQPSPPPHLPGYLPHHHPSLSSHNVHVQGRAQDNGQMYRRGSAPALRASLPSGSGSGPFGLFGSPAAGITMSGPTTVTLPGIPGNAFITHAPNFLNPLPVPPAMTAGSSRSSFATSTSNNRMPSPAPASAPTPAPAPAVRIIPSTANANANASSSSRSVNSNGEGPAEPHTVDENGANVGPTPLGRPSGSSTSTNGHASSSSNAANTSTHAYGHSHGPFNVHLAHPVPVDDTGESDKRSSPLESDRSIAERTRERPSGPRAKI